MNLLFYDIECFKFDSLVVFKRPDNSIHAFYWYSDDPDKYSGEIDEIINTHQLAGYNNYYYDDEILKLMSMGVTQDVVKANNDALINGDGINKSLRKINSIDLMQQIDISKPSLKLIEGNMGKSILESNVPFDIDRPLTAEEREDVLKYCCYDVEATIEIYKLRKDSYFTVKNELLKMIDNDMAGRWNTTSIVAGILCPGRKNYKKLNHIFMVDVDNRGKYPHVPSEVWNVWDRANREDIPKEASYTIDRFGCEVTFGFGGLHGAPVRPGRYRDVKLLDVGSMYPSIIVNQEALGEASTEIYDSIRRERLSIKHTDPIKAGALKLILNSTYGLLKNEYSLLYNPKASSQVCIFGQIALYDLCLRLDELGYRIVNINTDGVAFDDPYNVSAFGDIYKEAWEQWEKDYNLNLELDEFDLWIQRDVNNYIATQGDKIKVKGGDVNKAFKDKFFSNNSARILHQGLVYVLLHKDESDWQDYKLYSWLYEKLEEPILFQYILKAGKTFKGVYDLQENKYQNVNRVFACKRRGVSLRKVRQDGGFVKFPDAPDQMYVWNDDVKKLKNLGSIIDLNHYYQLILKKAGAWK